MLKVGDIIDTKKLVELFGTEKQKNSYYKNNKLRTNIKNSLLKNLSILADFEEIKKGRNKYYKIVYLKDEEESFIMQLENKSTKAIDKKIYNFISSLDQYRDNEVYDSIQYINRDGNEKIIITTNQFIKSLNLVNENFWDLNDYINYLNRNEVNIDEEFISSYFEVDTQIKKIYISLLKNELGNMIRGSLNRLKKNSNINFKDVIVIVPKSCDEIHIADEEEKEMLLSIEEEALNRLNCKTFRGVVYIGALDKYNKIIKELLLSEAFDDIKYFYKAYEICKLDLNNPTEEEKEYIIDMILNKKIRDMIYNRFKSRRETAIKHEKESTGFGEVLIKEIETKENFLSDIKKLINYTL